MQSLFNQIMLRLQAASAGMFRYSHVTHKTRGMSIPMVPTIPVWLKESEFTDLQRVFQSMGVHV